MIVVVLQQRGREEGERGEGGSHVWIQSPPFLLWWVLSCSFIACLGTTAHATHDCSAQVGKSLEPQMGQPRWLLHGAGVYGRCCCCLTCIVVGGKPLLTDVNTGRFNGAHSPKLFVELYAPTVGDLPVVVVSVCCRKGPFWRMQPAHSSLPSSGSYCVQSCMCACMLHMCVLDVPRQLGI